ncbi:hypothetical protein LMG032447_01178 [Convivina praedatoris]|uniref:LemA family protein n=1 Tax=Convivina praedatoris TaxID=2880963 RepID=A0ABN8HE09_9LACO|nr:hypothetical protein R077815_01064 [Convivina sp. LMG 32447]CAH1855852.1 hypothetical protein LMG032447_01178 [Convivina sp. LMG 32447]
MSTFLIIIAIVAAVAFIIYIIQELIAILVGIFNNVINNSVKMGQLELIESMRRTNPVFAKELYTNLQQVQSEQKTDQRK